MLNFYLRKNLRKNNEAFWDAAEQGNLEKLKYLLDEKKQVNTAQVNSK